MATGSAYPALFLSDQALAIAQADPGLIPIAPGPGDTFNVGSNCTIQWDVDQSGVWKNVTVDLMSGSNTNMSLVTNVVFSIDGTDPSTTTYDWPCPEVDPYSAIYFYQFTNNGQSDTAKWTTRFTLASPSGDSVPPLNAVQPSGEAIPWGVGQLATSNQTQDSQGPEVDDGSPQNQTSDADATQDAAQDLLVENEHPKLTGPLRSTTAERPNRPAGAKAANGSAEREKVSPWLQLYPLLIFLYFLY